MISTSTFAEYFSKDVLQEQTILPAMDVRIFGQYIAPCLNIKKRFVGEEPFDKVTRQYNDAMKSILPNFGIKLIEVPRLKNGKDVIINATSVRHLLSCGDLEGCHNFLTDETYHYIAENYSRIKNRLTRVIL